MILRIKSYAKNKQSDNYKDESGPNCQKIGPPSPYAMYMTSAPG